MASKVKVVDSNFRQIEIKVNPGTHLTEVLEQACAKFKADPTRHLLKYKQRQLDLSHTWRTSGLVQGAKLELVVRSTTPTAIDVALQLPPPESDAFPPHGRLTEKLPSDITIWRLLRHFESGAPSSSRQLNITGRGVPQTTTTTTTTTATNRTGGGSGQLFYETPVLQVGNRHLATFDDFQKTLSQLGYNSGRVLVRLSFQKTDKTFVDAVTEIDRYFQDEKQDELKQDEQQQKQQQQAQEPPPPSSAEAESTAPSEPTSSSTNQVTTAADAALSPDANVLSTEARQAPPPADDAMDIDTATAGPSTSALAGAGAQAGAQAGDPSHPVTIFAAPSSSTPQAALHADAEEAFVPGIEHAKAHQRLLKNAAQNRRLLSDQEIAEREAAARRRLADAASVRIRVRLPDASLLERDFGQRDTGADLYAVVRAAMANPHAGFRITAPPPTREPVRDSGGSGEAAAERDRLITGYGFRGQVVLTFVWDDDVPAHVRKAPFLRPGAAAAAKQVVIPAVPDVVDERDSNGDGGSGSGNDARAAVAEASASAKRGLDALKGKTPKWLKGLGGKK